MKRIIFDLDNTLCLKGEGDYVNALPRLEVIERLRSLHSDGYEIIISTSRNVNTFASNVGKINALTLPLILDWLKRHNVPFDEIYVGKPWCGDQGFYVDDRAVRPSELVKHSVQEIHALLARELP
jgi:capsule biosynthesis phosphatase